MRKLAYYPVFMNIRGKRCVVVGGGEVALRKVRLLLDCGANVIVISPSLTSDLAQMAQAGTISLISRQYGPGDLKEAFIIVAATDVRKTNRRIAEEARRQGRLVNVVDSPEQSDFIIPSLFHRGDLIFAVSTSGTSPALAKKIRTRLEEVFGEEYALLLSMIKEIRKELKMQGGRVNTGVWQEALDLDFLISLIKAGEREKARAALLEKLNSPREGT